MIRRRKRLLVILAALLAGGVWSLEQGRWAPQPAEEVILRDPEILDRPTRDQIEQEAVRKGIELAELYIVPGLPAPNSARIPESRAQAMSLGRFDGVDACEVRGVVQHQANESEAAESEWLVLLGYRDHRFYAARVALDGVDVPFLETNLGRSLREAVAKQLADKQAAQ